MDTSSGESSRAAGGGHDGKQGASTAVSGGSQEGLTRRTTNVTSLGDEDEKEGLSTTDSPQHVDGSGNHIAIADPKDRDPSRRGTRESNKSRRSTPERSNTGGASLGRKATWASLFKPERPIKKEPSYMQSLKRAVFCTWLNLLLVFVPVSWALHFAKVGDAAIFVTSMLCASLADVCVIVAC